MDWKSFAEQFDPMTCVLSVEKRPEGGYGTIRIVAGNQGYLDSLALAAGGVALDSGERAEFVPGSAYTRYIPRDLNFEEVCHRCAVGKQPMQNIVHMVRYPFDIKAFFMPLAYEEPGVAYCTYSQILTPRSDSSLLTMNISLETAMEVVRTCLKLRGSRDLRESMGEVMEGIRTLCGAEFCCLLLLDGESRDCTVLGQARRADSRLPWMERVMDQGFYDLARTWLDTIGGSFCLAVRGEGDMDYIRQRNPAWAESLERAGVESLVIFPLFNGDRFLGYLWAANIDTENTETIKSTLELTSAFLAAELSGALREGGREGNLIGALREDLDQYVDHLNTQANSMITAMAADYRSVYYVDLDRDDGVCYRADPADRHQPPRGAHFPFREKCAWYAENIVTEGYREGFLRFVDPENIRRELETQPIIAYRYLARMDGREYYEMLRMAGVRRAEERDDHMVHAIGMGFTEIDAETRASMARNEALAEALRAAEEASRAKTAFLSNMSHEIRTPMNAIIGMDKLALMDRSLQSQTRGYLEKIGESARHLLEVLNEILDMSRIESGRLTLERADFSLGELLEEVDRTVRPQFRQKGLDYSGPAALQGEDRFLGDGPKLREALLHILSNALKFTDPPGQVSLEVRRTAAFDGQSTLRFTVRDTGIGMSRDFLPRVFDPFSQEDSTRKNRYGSTGLGMAITKAIVEMMNGAVTAESEKGAGSVFTVTVTLRNAAPRTASESEAPAASLAGRRVLLAEDVEINAEIMTELLGMEDVTADHAANGRLALEMFRDSPPGYYDAVLMDIRMPEMDGLEAASAIRALDRPDAGRVPIVALTANAFDEDVQRSLQAGMNAHLSKPVDSDKLMETLAALIGAAEAGSPGVPEENDP